MVCPHSGGVTLKEIPLTQGKVALVDDEDFDRVNQFKWCAQKRRCGGFYAVRKIRVSETKWTNEYLHCFILGRKRVDHKNGDSLDNQKQNLRAATPQQNCRNRRKKIAGATSKFRGVYWCSGRRRWCASLKVKGRRTYLGYFKVEAVAAKAYDAGVRQFFGKFASPNFS